MNPISDPSFELLLKFMERFFKMNTAFKKSFRLMLFEVAYKRGSRLLNYKQTQGQLWFVLHGLIREIHVDELTLEEHTSWFWWEGSLVCADPGFFSQEPSEKTIEVLEDCRLVCFSYQDWSILKHDFSEADVVTERLRSLYARGRQRFLEELVSRSAEERYLNHREELEQLFLRTKVKYLAEYLGMSADTMGRLRKMYVR